MRNARSSKILKLVLNDAIPNSEKITTDEDYKNESPVPPEAVAQWDEYKTMFDESFLHSSRSIDSSTYILSTHKTPPNILGCNESLTPLPSTSYTAPNDVVGIKDKDTNSISLEPNITQPSLVITPMPSPPEDFLDYHVAASTPLFQNIRDLDISSSSSGSRASTRQFTTASSQDSSVCSSNNSTPSNRIGRKRQRHRDEWKDIKRKCLKNLGKAYLSKNGVSRDAKQLKESCPTTCRLKCFQMFNLQERERIFTSFWQLGDHSRQWYYIVNHTDVGDTKYPSSTKAVSRRKRSVKYYLPVIESSSEVPNKMTVCKTMFLNTLSIGERTVQTAISKWCLGGGSVSPDRRGGSRVLLIDDEMKQSVIRHVKTFQPVESHYVRRDSSKLYLDGDLTFTKMFSLKSENILE